MSQPFAVDEGSHRGAAPAAVPASAPAASGGRAIARNAMFLLLGQAATTVLAVLLSAVLGRSLGAGDFGLLFLITNMAQFAFVVVEWGQHQYVVREVARDQGKAGTLLGSMLALRVLGTALLAVATVLVAWGLGYDPRTRGLAALLMVAMLPFVLAQGFALIFRGHERMELEALVSVLNKAGILVLTVLALSLGFGLPGAIVSQGFAGVVALGAAAWLSRRLDLPKVVASRAGMRQILAGGAPIVMMSVAISAQSYLEAIVLSKLGSAESVGWFGAARMILGTLIAPATILGTSFHPRLSRVAGDPVRFAAELQTTVRPFFGLAVLGAVGTYLYAPGAVHLIYGEEGFGPAALILQVFAPGFLILFLDIVLASAVLAAGRSVPLSVGKVINIAVGLVLAVLLVPICQERWGNGGIGIAIAFCLAELIMLLTALWLLPKGALPLSSLGELARAVVAGALTFGLFAVAPELPLLVGAPLCVLVFALFAVATGLVRRSEVAQIAAAIRRRIGLSG